MKKFCKGDLIKNKKNITWRDQGAYGVIVKDCGNFVGRQVVRIRWIAPPAYAAKGCVTHYGNSLEIVAKA
tara:strand:+ start:1602 stop:1811 length:210 start_codon:yes stop_codon:yes gene_type:complete